MRKITSIITFYFLFVLISCSQNDQNSTMNQNDYKPEVNKTAGEWKKELTDIQFSVTRGCGTERPFTGKYNDFYEKGVYKCICCGNELFKSSTKFKSGSGWPSFYDVLANKNVRLLKDHSHGMERTEVRCARCDAHLGHVFKDGPEPTGLRYCINSAALDFEKEKE